MSNIKRHGLEDNTIILFMSDNGGLSAGGRGGQKHTHNKPLNSGKGSAYEGGVRVPMIVKWPTVTRPGSVSDAQVIIEDYFPTILEMAGVRQYSQIGGKIDGISFVPLLKGKSPNRKNRPLIWHFPNKWGGTGPGIGPHSAIRKGDWKLIYYHSTQKYELFNIENDIGEMNNLSEEKPDIVKQLATELRNFLLEANAQMPIDKQTGNPVYIP
jgi:arylsulfatase A-like enzyme